MRGERPPEKADAIVLFKGATDRIALGYDLATEGYSNTLVISSSDRGRLNDYERSFNGGGPDIAYLVEKQGRTTYEDAHHAARIVRNSGIRSILLVTSWYHMPRAYLLMRLTLLGSEVAIQPQRAGRYRWEGKKTLRIVYRGTPFNI